MSLTLLPALEMPFIFSCCLVQPHHEDFCPGSLCFVLTYLAVISWRPTIFCKGSRDGSRCRLEGIMCVGVRKSREKETVVKMYCIKKESIFSKSFKC